MDKIKYLWSKTNRWHRAFFIFFVVESKVLPAGQLGFTCNDPALSYPYTGDTISLKLLLATTIVLPLAVMLIVERKYHSDKTVKPKQQALHWFKEYLFGVLLNLIVIQVIKLIVGSPRPHFFDTCSPKEALTCTDSEYVPTYTCTKAHWMSQSDRSFPSGHTSLAVHTGLFLAYYIRRRTSRPSSKTIRLIQAVCIASAVICSVSRMTDHRHHWWDVLAGATLATPILFYTVYSLCENFECTKVSTEDPTGVDTRNDAPLISTRET
ncbi:putative phosphatidate phosphatase [Trichoplusia ni]|uniref:Phosphatidate phosphatase n=1 Tax=Trichoplusia ni TaxID=7111 RepID=A0A7E5WGV0_TRINI|nr:putative phosphatidate phosphatase [Trichoplusia ni]